MKNIPRQVFLKPNVFKLVNKIDMKNLSIKSDGNEISLLIKGAEDFVFFYCFCIFYLLIMEFNLKRLTQMIIKSYNTKIQKNYNHFFQVASMKRRLLIWKSRKVQLRRPKSTRLLLNVYDGIKFIYILFYLLFNNHFVNILDCFVHRTHFVCLFIYQCWKHYFDQI